MYKLAMVVNVVMEVVVNMTAIVMTVLVMMLLRSRFLQLQLRHPLLELVIHLLLLGPGLLLVDLFLQLGFLNLLLLL